MTGTLYVCGTPIGNLEDVTVRLLKTLRQVDFIACEDTRHTVKLLNHYKIKKKLISYHEFSGPEREYYIVRELEAGHSVALVSDAGMPGISDPGQELIRKVIAARLPVVIVPGPSALIAGLVLSGLESSVFVFQGFLPSSPRERRAVLDNLRHEKRTMVFYEAPHRLLGTLSDMLEYLGNRSLAVGRELTKLHEQVVRGSMEEVMSHFSQHKPRGELVLVVEGEPEKRETVTLEEAARQVLDLMATGTEKKEALKIKASQYGFKKSDLYKIVDRIRDEA